MNFYTVLTTKGQAKLAEAIGFGRTVDLTHIALGDGNGNTVVPTEGMTSLTREIYRASINSLTIDPQNPNWLVAELVIPTDVGGWTVREVGVFDVDGNLFAVGNFPETYKPQLAEGSGRELTVRIYIEVSSTNAVTLVVDPSITFATREYVESLVSQHESQGNHSSATTSSKGMVELATDEEAKSGIDTERAVTPAGLKTHVAAQFASTAATYSSRGTVELADEPETLAGVDAQRVVTPAGLKAFIDAEWSGKNASSSLKGIVELATEDEAKAGVDDQRAITAAGLAAHVSEQISSASKGARARNFFMGQI